MRLIVLSRYTLMVYHVQARKPLNRWKHLYRYGCLVRDECKWKKYQFCHQLKQKQPKSDNYTCHNLSMKGENTLNVHHLFPLINGSKLISFISAFLFSTLKATLLTLLNLAKCYSHQLLATDCYWLLLTSYSYNVFRDKILIQIYRALPKPDFTEIYG